MEQLHYWQNVPLSDWIVFNKFQLKYIQQQKKIGFRNCPYNKTLIVCDAMQHDDGLVCQQQKLA